ncbi:MAG: FHA domain-containing protein [Gemmatimonadales bacterium]
MFAQFRYLEGQNAGSVRVPAADFATIGRHPASDVPFDPAADLRVSIRHAAVFKQGGGYLVRDLGSTNGTYLNGERVRGDVPIDVGDVIQLGPDGPSIEFGLTEVMPRDLPSQQPMPRTVPQPRVRPVRPTQEYLAPPRRRSSAVKWVAGVAAALGILVAAQIALAATRERERLENQRTALLGRVDDLLTRLEQSESRVGGLETALGRARSEVSKLRSSITTTESRAATLDTLTDELANLSGRHDNVLRAAALDPDAVTAGNDSAVAVVLAERLDGDLASGTGFALRARGDTVWVVTARDVVVDSAGLPATRVALIFNGTNHAYRATLTRVHDSADIVVLTARVRGGVPVVKGVTDSVVAGTAVATLGFPGGLDSLGDWQRRGAHATALTGTVAAVTGDHLSIDGYGQPAAPGAPIILPSGAVAGVVAGRPDADGLVRVVPGRWVRELFRTEGPAGP